MQPTRVRPLVTGLFFFFVAGLLLARPAQGQFGGGIFGAGGFGGVFGQGGLGGQVGQGGQQGQAGQAGVAGAAGGIMIDAQGVVRPVYSKIRSDRLQQKRVEARARKFLPADLNTSSKLRKVSLVELERVCGQYARSGKHVPLDIQYLAGLQRIDYVFVFPEEGDIVLAGPAEGFGPDDTGRVVGVTTGRPPLRIDDLVIALRALYGGEGQIGCSIDPQPENLRKLLDYVRRNSSPASPSVARRRYAEMARILGVQTIRVWGVPPESHFGQTLVEADYRMKRISMGLERVPIRGFRSHLAMLSPGGNSMQRWWFTPLYSAFLTTKDGNAFQLTGQRAQLLSQEELPTVDGGRKDAPTTRLSTKAFARHFTDRFPQLAEKVPVFAELQNLIDLAIVAALLKKRQLPEKVGWKMSLFLDPRQAPVIKGYAPKSVPSAFNYKSVGGRLILGLVGGGVIINPTQTVEELRFEVVTRGGLPELRDDIPRRKKQSAQRRWWWD